jgi:hypothetical protein
MRSSAAFGLRGNFHCDFSILCYGYKAVMSLWTTLVLPIKTDHALVDTAQTITIVEVSDSAARIQPKLLPISSKVLSR